MSEDEDIPVLIRRELMACSMSNGRIDYHYLCDVWRRGYAVGRGVVTRDTQEERVAAVMRGLSSWESPSRVGKP